MAECNNYTGLQINPTPSSIGNQYAGVSTDDKPANAPTYSVYLELDTGKFYYYDGTEWKEVPCCGDGGGGGGGSVATAQVTFINSAADSSAAYVVLLSFPINEDIKAIVVGHTPVSVDVPLYNGAYVLRGTAFGLADFSTEPTITGSITWDDDKFAFLIRGDGTITLAPEK